MALEPIKKQAVEASVQPIQFYWGELHAGDCVMLEGATLTLFPTGFATFDATTLTHHTVFGDVWHASFQIRNEAGFVLFTVGEFNSPTMTDEGKEYIWINFGVPYDNRGFTEGVFAQAWMYFSC
jgi:hypothetical protein